MNEPEVSKSALARSEFDYVALGHIHKFQDLNAGHQPPIVYSGSIDRIDFGERNESKGYVLVKLAKGSSSYQFIESPSRPFIEIDVDATQSVDPTEAVLREIAKVDLDHAVVKLIYRVRVSDEHLLDERRIHAALSLAFIKIAVRKEVIGDQSLSRGIEHSESADTIEILCRFIEKRPELLKYKEQLCERAQWLIAQDNESLSNL